MSAFFRFMLVLLFGCTLGHAEDTMSVKADEQVVFYPTVAQRILGKNEWKVQVRGLIYEPEKRAITLALVRGALNLKDVELTEAEQKIFNERARLFLADHERGKKIFVRLGAEVFSVGKSAKDGTFTGEISVRDEIVRNSRLETNRAGGWIEFEAALPPGVNRVFRGRALMLEATGLSVISDVDDTIKISQVRDRNQMLRNTFAREFEAAPEMANFYRRLAAKESIAFHYVSASPWQLFQPLNEFVQRSKFPDGTFALKGFRWKNQTALSLFANPEKYKPTVIEPLLKQFPERRFILIGDSGERDPEVYAALARKFPKQIERIYIRDVTDESTMSERYQKVFRGLPAELWTIFSVPVELELPSATPAR